MSLRDNLAAIIGEHIDKCRTNEEIADAFLADPQIKAALELADVALAIHDHPDSRSGWFNSERQALFESLPIARDAYRKAKEEA